MIAAFIDGLFRYQFLQNALLTSVIVGLISGVIGSFIILRGMSLMGDAISHAVLPGVAVSYMFGFNYIFGASIFGLLAALSIGFITQKSPLKNDTAIGVVFSSFFALGIIFISFAKSSTDLYHILFGNVLKSVLLRMVTLLFLSAGSLLGGTAIVETIFMWNGVGKMAVDAVSMHDIPVIQAYLVWMAAIYLLLHLIADLMMGALDPRAKLEGMR